MDALALDATLLVVNSQGGFSSLWQVVEWGCVGDLVSLSIPECCIQHTKGNSATFCFGVCVLANSEQEVEGNVDQVCNGFSSCIWAQGLCLVAMCGEEVLSDFDWDGEFG